MSEFDTATFISKVWGSELCISNNELYCLKLLSLYPGFQSSRHFHVRKDETFYVERGWCWLEVGDAKFKITRGDAVRLAPGTIHRFSNTSPVVCKIIEVSTHHSDEDVHRLEESRAI